MYLTADAIASRLDDRFGIEAEIAPGDAEMASYELDSQGPFIGARQDSEQEMAFPRTLNPNGTENEDTTIPAAVLDWVALCAYRITGGDAPGIVSRSRSGLSESYSRPVVDKNERRMNRLLWPYLASGHASVGIDSTLA